MIDASFTVAHRQRNTREENKKIKDGQGDDLWKDRPHKKSHKDIDARWTKKNNENFYGYKNSPLTEEQKKNNTERSRTRARVEHVFGFMEQSMNGLKLRSVGIARATGIIGLINLTYNLFRYEQVIRSAILPVKG